MNNTKEFGDTKGVIKICISKKNRQHNDKKKVQKDKQRSTKHTHKTKDRVTVWCFVITGESNNKVLCYYKKKRSSNTNATK